MLSFSLSGRCCFSKVNNLSSHIMKLNNKENLQNDEPLTVLYVVGGLSMGGLERQLYLLLSQLDRRLIRPVLAAWCPDSPEQIERLRKMDVPVHTVQLGGSRLSRLKQLCRIAKEVNPRYLHSYSFYMNFPTWMAAKACGALGVLGSYRSDYWNERMECGVFMGRLNARYPRNSIANSNKTANAIRSHRSLFRSKQVWVVPNAVDTQSFCPQENGTSKKVSPKINLIGVGHLRVEKRWIWLMGILEKINRDIELPDWHFTLYGEGPERSVLQKKIDMLGLGGRVTLAGFQKNVAHGLQQSDVLLLCSAYEGTPNVVMEALSCGVPVLSTDVSDVQSILRDGIDGYVVGVDHQEQYQKRLTTLVLSKDLRNEMGRAGRRRMEECFAPTNLFQQTYTVYREAGWAFA